MLLVADLALFKNAWKKKAIPTWQKPQPMKIMSCFLKKLNLIKNIFLIFNRA
jgi:hypothetical protein